VGSTAAYSDALQAEGQAGYLPNEIALLRELETHDPAVFPVKVRSIQQVKQLFRAVIKSLERVDKPIAAPVSQPKAGACYICGTRRRWRSICGVLICGTCHPPPADVALVAGWLEDDGRDD
jgi:hypothetical protein